MSVSALHRGIKPSKIRVEMIKTSINFVYPNLWPQELVDYKIWLSCSSMSTTWR